MSAAPWDRANLPSPVIPLEKTVASVATGPITEGVVDVTIAVRSAPEPL